MEVHPYLATTIAASINSISLQKEYLSATIIAIQNMQNFILKNKKIKAAEILDFLDDIL
jgi:hypothetical protein